MTVCAAARAAAPMTVGVVGGAALMAVVRVAAGLQLGVSG